MLNKTMIKYLIGQLGILLVFIVFAKGLIGDFDNRRNNKNNANFGVAEVERQIQEIQRERGVNVNSEILALQAVREAIHSRDSSSISDKMKFLQSSMHLFEQSIENEPSNPKVRMHRLTTLHQIPFFFRNNQFVESDIKCLDNWIEQNTKNYNNQILFQSVCEVLKIWGKNNKLCNEPSRRGN